METTITAIIDPEVRGRENMEKVAQEIKDTLGEDVKTEVLPGPGAVVLTVATAMKDRATEVLNEHPDIRNDVRGVHRKNTDSAQ